jgi:hypothetical protein
MKIDYHQAHAACTPIRWNGVCSSLPNSVFSDIFWSLKISHGESIYTTEIGKCYRSHFFQKTNFRLYQHTTDEAAISFPLLAISTCVKQSEQHQYQPVFGPQPWTNKASFHR